MSNQVEYCEACGGRVTHEDGCVVMPLEAELDRLTLVAQTHIDAVVGMSERIAKLEAALKPFADAIDSDRPDLALTLHDLRMAHEAIAEVDDKD